MEIELTEWMPCSMEPCHEGWYDVVRVVLGREQPVERVPYRNGKWDHEASESRVAVWRHHDYWRGVQGEEK